MENVVYEPQKSLGTGPPVGTRTGSASRATRAQGSGRRARRPSLFGRSLTGRAALTAVAATALAAGALAAASPASAASPKWGYEQISPADSTSNGIYGVGVSEDMSTAFVATMSLPLVGLPPDGRNINYFFGLPRAGRPWVLGPIDVANGSQSIGNRLRGVSPDGTHAIYQASLAALDSGWHHVGADGVRTNMTGGQALGSWSISSDRDLVAMRNTGTANNRPVYLGRPGQPAVQISLDNAGTPMNTTSLGGANSGSNLALADNALSADGSSVIFTSTTAIPGDGDGARRDVLRRVLTPGHEQTTLISDANASGDPDAVADASYRWATADHSRVFFVTSEALEAGDTDGQQDLYVRDGSAAPVRVSKGELVDGAPTGNGSGASQGLPEWSMSSDDGERTYFVTWERLTQDAPDGDTPKLYERDLAQGRTRLVATVLVSDVTDGNDVDLQGGLTNGRGYLGFRGIRPIPSGVVFMSQAALAGAPDNGLNKVFRWTRDGGLAWISAPETGAPSSPAAAATFMPRDLSGTVVGNEVTSRVPDLIPAVPARGVSDDGSSVFFSTTESLTAEDTDDGYGDVYRWSEGEGLRLVTPTGRAPYHAGYLDSSPDGTQVYFGTTESILPGDTDPNANDVYLAILGGGSPPGAPVPDADPEVCAGDACQGPPTGPVALAGIGSVGFAGAGNLLASPDPLSISVVVPKARTGSAATLKVRVPGAGRISVSGASLRRAEKSASKAGTFAVKVGSSTNARAALRRGKTLKARARVVFRAKDGRTASKVVTVTFRPSKVSSAATTKGGR